MIEKQSKSNHTLLCDADGTLLQSKSWIMDAVYHTAEYFGLTVSPDELYVDLLKGLPLSDVYRKYAPHIDYVECIKIHHRHQMENMDSITLFPGVADTIQKLDARRVRLGIVTTRKFRSPLLATLKRWDIDAFFGAVICLEDVARAKPDPEGTLLAMRMLHADPAHTFFIGDVPTDIQTGKNAGIKTIGALYGFAGERLLVAEADWYIYNFSAVFDIVVGS